MNKTDVETLRASFGVRLNFRSPPFLLPLPHDSTQSFAKIAQADTEQLARLPGFGPKKVARLKDAFESPFRTGTTGDALPTTGSGSGPAASTSASISATATTSAPAVPVLPSSSSGNKGGEGSRRAGDDTVWDIELDLNSPSPEPAPAKRARESPPWDIEVDEGGALPSRDEVSISSDESDADIAPALRAKRRRA